MAKKVMPGSIEEKILNDIYPRRMAMEYWPDVFKDKGIIDLFNQFDFKPKKKPGKMDCMRAAVTQFDVVQVCKKYLEKHPEACVVNMGCGFDTTFQLIDNGQCQGYNVDFLDVMLLRKPLVGKGDRENSIAGDLTELKWMDKIDKYDPNKGIVFYATNLFHYFKREDVQSVLAALAGKFRGACIVIDAYSAEELKRYLKTKFTEEEMEDVGFYFSVDTDAQVRKWSMSIEDIYTKGIYTGYLSQDQLGDIDLLTRMAMKNADKGREAKILEIYIKLRFIA